MNDFKIRIADFIFSCNFNLCGFCEIFIFFILYFLTKLAIFRPTLQNEMWYQVWPSTLLRFQINQVHLTPLGHYIFYSIMGIK